jgi:predicted dehydrogenase
MGSVKLGVIGCGVIGQRHVKAAVDCPYIDLTAVADIRGETAKTTAEQYKIPSWHDSAEKLLSDKNVEAVVLALPAGARTDLAPKALSAGKHVLIEKPAAMNASELEYLRQQRKDRVVAFCSSRLRFLPSWKKATELVAKGVLGNLRVVSGRMLEPAGAAPNTPPPAWRLSRKLNGGGLAVNWGSYDLDYLLSMTGWSLNPKTVLAQTWGIAEPFACHAAPGSDAETHFAVLIRCAGGEVITLERGEFTAARAERAWQVTGTLGALHFDLMGGKPNKIELDQAVAGRGIISQTVWQGDEDWNEIHKGPVRDFTAAILEQRSPATGLEGALKVQRILDAIYASAASGQAVSILE